MKTLRILCVVTVLFAFIRSASSQDFVNLDFESAIIKDVYFFTIPATNAFPGWTVSTSYVVYDTVSLSGESISICDSNAPFSLSPTEGNYFALLASGNYPGYGFPISIGQIGQIPLSAQSITFWGDIGALEITFNGQPLSFAAISGTATGTLYGADISGFAGQTGQLLFTLPPYVGDATIDDIEFSSIPVPEPSAMTILSFCISFFCRRKTRPNTYKARAVN